MSIQGYNPQIKTDIKLRANQKVSNLERVRVSRGMTQAQLAEKSGISLRTIQGFERLARNINGTDIERLLDFCIALNCRIEDIIEGNDAIKKAKMVRELEPQETPCGEPLVYEYPQNLLQDIFEDFNSAQNCIDSEHTLEYLYGLIPENWGEILKLRYRDKHTLEQIGSRYQVTRMRAGQIVHFALEKLREPNHIVCLQMGVDAYKAYCEEKVHDEVIQKESRPLADISIEELNLSGRAYSSLMKAGYNTIDKVAEIDLETLMAIKNMGKSAAIETLERIEAYLEQRNEKTIEFKKIYEHDMDLLIMEEFVSDKKFARLFLDKLQLPDNYEIHKAFHSLADADGESDITLILQYPDKKVALLIEDKIDAQTMPEQSQRYHKRAKNAILRGEYNAYYIILAAPADYLKEHEHDGNAAYEYKISYEDLRDYLGQKTDVRAKFKTTVIDCALREKKAGYRVQEVPSVTNFWMQLRQLCREEYPQLIMVGEDAPKGAAARWPEFRTSLGKIKVIYKSQNGIVDLEFPRYGDRIAYLRSVIGDRLKEPMQIWQTGKSASVRLSDERWRLDFSQDFEKHRSTIMEVLQAVSVLCEFASTLNYSELY